MATGKKFNVDPKCIAKWVNQYKSGGIDAIELFKTSLLCK
ncbi:helix-turn-helix domain-containing protein [Otariodibacter sp.]